MRAGRRVSRWPAYQETRANEGVITSLAVVSGEHYRITWDDGKSGLVHWTALRLMPKPPPFASTEEADAWMERLTESI